MFNKKPLMCAGISAILLVFLPMIFSMLGLIGWTNFFAILSYMVGAILSGYYFYGFYYLGTKYKSRLLSVISLIGIIFVVLIYLVMIFGNNSFNVKMDEFNQTITQQQMVLDNLKIINATADEISLAETSIWNTIVGFLGVYFVLFLVVLFLWMICSLIFNIALIKLKKVEYAKITGILGLVSIGLVITIIGIFFAIPILIAYEVMLIIILFNQAKKFKEYNNYSSI